MLSTRLPVAQWLEHATGIRKVMGSIPVGDSDFFFSPLTHARDILNIPSSLIRFQFPPMDGRALKMSGIGKTVMYLCRHPKETRQNKKVAGKLISEYLLL